MMLNRRSVLGLVLAAIPAAAYAKPPKAAEMIVYKSPHCGCCSAWVEQVKASGLKTIVHERKDVTPMAKKLGVPDALRSCHTAEIAGYFIEGHVPVADIRKLLRERPQARGLSVPGMPIGSPGMEQGDRRDAFNVLIVERTGTARVFARHNQTPSR